MYLCKICLSQTRSLRDKKKDIIYHRCVACGFIFLDNSAIVDRVCEKKHYEKYNNSFKHLKEPKKVLKTLVNSLNDNGYIVLMTQFPPLDDEEFLKWWYRRDITHISFFTPQSFKIMAEEMGVNILKIIDNNIVLFQKNYL